MCEGFSSFRERLAAARNWCFKIRLDSELTRPYPRQVFFFNIQRIKFYLQGCALLSLHDATSSS